MTISIITLILVILSCDTETKETSKVEASFKSLNLDTLFVDEKREVPCTLYSTGKDTAIIYKFTCSCECTIPNLTEGVKIPPGDSLRFSFSINSYPMDKGKSKNVLCTFKTNAEITFLYLKFNYFVKS